MELEELLKKFKVGNTFTQIIMYSLNGSSYYKNVRINKREGKFITASAIKNKDENVELTLDFEAIKEVHPFPPGNNEFTYMLVQDDNFEVQCTIIP